MDSYHFNDKSGKAIVFTQREDGGITIGMRNNTIVVNKDRVPEFLSIIRIVFFDNEPNGYAEDTIKD